MSVEHRIPVIKEHCRGILCTLPYTHFPQIKLVHLLHHVVMWLNNFPVKNGISGRFSPREIILHHKLNFKHQCRAPFVLGACWGTEELGWNERSWKKLRDVRQQSNGFENYEL